MRLRRLFAALAVSAAVTVVVVVSVPTPAGAATPQLSGPFVP